MAWWPGWNSLSSTNFWETFYFWFGIACLFLLGGAEVISHYYGERHKALITATENATDEQRRKDQQQADQRHAAEIVALQDRLAPRSIIASEQPGFLNSVQQYKGQEYSLWVGASSESQSFACDIDAILRKAGWNIHWPIKGEIVTGIFRSPCGEGFVRRAEGTDVFITVNPNPAPSTLSAATALVNAFQTAHITTHAAQHALAEELPPNVVGVLIGNKQP